MMAPETAPVELLLIFEVGNTPYKVLRKYRGKDLSKGTIEAELYDENKKPCWRAVPKKSMHKSVK
ncbi:MAG: hypothetical protein IPL35_07780 [Sphingobacteriales bacterium]|nr:hypothetical protein [Sphingobacteriales bacterium]